MGVETNAREAFSEGNERTRPSPGVPESNRKSLKQLIKSRNSLSQHFTAEEKQLQIVPKQQKEEGVHDDGVKLKKMVSRYAKFLSRLIKVKRDLPKGGESRKKPLLLLKA
ncbi:hypothetical protein CMV_011076 [Castanea mollissima]|uniref:Uncharacterized protein n=1 Tax=Castanea mollissima TaxID=60419 RepID=A0A8J4RI51_9ROSI|nr:hypothetical protein CMV_011076 [Castanea mollissima]